MRNRTKIICTIGPSVNSYEKIVDLIQAGMNVARLNFSHGTHEEHGNTIQLIKQARLALSEPIAIMLDTKGPEIRLGKIKNGEVFLKAGQIWQLVGEEIEGNEQKVSLKPAGVLKKIKIGTRILFDDGYIGAKVVDIQEDNVTVELENSGFVKSGKGVNIPDTPLGIPCITEKDIEDIKFGCEQDVDFIAASFVKNAEDILCIKKILAKEKKSDILVLAKIETAEGVFHFDSIVQVADGIMIARGDLGVEIPLSEVPRLQKMMIKKSYLAGKPAVTATQMLESMINNPRPTRAEVSDVANAIYDSSSALMLSGETAIGKYPMDTVRMMKSIIAVAEQDFDYKNFLNQHASLVYHDVPSTVTSAAVKAAYYSEASAIFAFTNSGTTPRLISRLRPKMPIVAMTSREKCYHQLAFNWGVIPFFEKDHSKSIDEAFKKISNFTLENNLLSYGDLVVIAGGWSSFGISGTTNTMIVESIGDVLVRGHWGYGKCIHGNVSMLLTPEEKAPYAVRDQIIVITKCDETYSLHLVEALGIVLQNHIDDTHSEEYAIKMAKILDKPLIVRGDGATRILKEGQLITLDPEKAIVYKGVVSNTILKV